jgi:SAM-dependent MidA family methyltransferase
MTPLAAVLARRIAAAGPISVAEYMADCLMNPVHGYYTTRDPLGAKGDFTTAPEISQMFGELLGLALAQSWLDQGAPAPFLLAELGPGRGTLIADALRATKGVPGFHAALGLHLVEVSPALRARQAEALAGFAPCWHERIDTLPEGPLFLIANEFFDALPIRQFVRDPAGWRERQVALRDGRLSFGLSAPAPLAVLAHRLADTQAGDIVETCAASLPIVAEIGRRIAAHGGAALVVDYGGWRSRGDTLQAVRDHAHDDPLAHPGEADLTAHVDFEALAGAAAPAAHSSLVSQGVLLECLGITERARALAARLDGPALEAHIAAHRRLTHPEEMGRVFQSLAIHPRTVPPPPGYT